MAAVSTQNFSLARLFARLTAAGLPQDYVRRVAFPSWWNDQIATEQAGYERALGLIHRNLGVPLEQLWDAQAVIQCPAMGRVHFKKSKNTSEKDFEWARCIGVSAAGLALSAMRPAVAELPDDPREVRREIMAAGHSWVDLRALLDYLWSRGVPVLHIDQFPGKKMVGMAARVHDRAAVVLSKNHKYPALEVFDLAHEVGHIINGDLAADDAIVDEVIDQSDTTDPREVEATRSGVAVLTGDKDKVFKKPFFVPVAGWAQRVGEAEGVSPGVVAQNLGFHAKMFGLGNGGCKVLEANQNPVQIIREKMMDELDFDELSDEEAQFLMRTAGEGIRDAVPAGH
jgi:hypothetical protein